MTEFKFLGELSLKCSTVACFLIVSKSLKKPNILYIFTKKRYVNVLKIFLANYP